MYIDLKYAYIIIIEFPVELYDYINVIQGYDNKFCIFRNVLKLSNTEIDEL
jgi:hypothetical protein